MADDIEQLIQAKGKTAARVAPADVESSIASEYYFTAFDGARAVMDHYPVAGELPVALGLLTFCVLVLDNGFSVTGSSACAAPENFDAEIGRKVARGDAVRQVWPLLGYALRSDLMGE